MQLEDNYSLLQDNTISILKNYPRFLTLLKAIGNRLDSLQNCVNFLCENTNKDKAEGIWLDYIGWLVGDVREEYIDTSDFFCANAEDVNVPKRFYFPNLSKSLGITSSLGDALFQGQINAKIAYNVSNGTREDNIRIIKPLVNADKVVITNYAPMELEIAVYGQNILTANIKSRIESVLAPGVSVHGDVVVYNNLSYEEIERLINGIVEMTNISEPDPNYEYIEINDDLDYILEIE